MLAVLTCLAVAACGPLPADGIVAVTDDPRFFPAHMYVQPGGTIEWRNYSAAPHVIAATAVPPRGERFLSPPIRPGGFWRHTFLEPGTYRYACALMGGEELEGIIEVR